MDRDFEIFRGGPTQPLQDRLYVTLSPTRNIILNANAYKRLGSPAAVRLYYSRRRDTIGIELAGPDVNDAFPVVPNGRGWRISAAPFCRHFGITVDTTVKFISPQFTGDSLLLDLTATIAIARKRRTKAELEKARRANGKL